MATTGVSQEQLRERVRLYLQVILVIDLAAYASDLVPPLLFEGAQTLSLPRPFW